METQEWAGNRKLQADLGEAVFNFLVRFHPVDRMGALQSVISSTVLSHAENEADALRAIDAIAGDMRDGITQFFAKQKGLN